MVGQDPAQCWLILIEVGYIKPNSVPLLVQLLLLADRLHVLIWTPACPRKHYVEPNVDLMLAQHHGRWTSIKPTLVQRFGSCWGVLIWTHVPFWTFNSGFERFVPIRTILVFERRSERSVHSKRTANSFKKLWLSFWALTVRTAHVTAFERPFWLIIFTGVPNAMSDLSM